MENPVAKIPEVRNPLEITLPVSGLNGVDHLWSLALQNVAPRLEELAEYRNYSVSTCQWMLEKKLVGWHKDWWAFPNCDSRGRLCSIHYLNRACKDGQRDKWKHDPSGANMYAFSLGNPAARQVAVFESQWDMFAFVDLMGPMAIDQQKGEWFVSSSCGTGHKCFDRVSIYPGARVYIFAQNDPPSLQWESSLLKKFSQGAYLVRTPKPWKDLNEALQAGLGAETLKQWIDDATLESAHQAGYANTWGEYRHGEKTETEEERATRLEELEAKLPDYLTRPQGRDLKAKGEIPQPRDIIPNFIRAGQILVCGGSSKAGKTFLALYLVETASNSVTFLGAFTPQKIKVLYVGFELDDYELEERLSEIENELGVETGDNLATWCLRRKYLGLEDFCDILKNKIESFKPDLVVVDPIYTLLGNRDENKVTDMTDLLKQLALVQDHFNGSFALVLVHHFPKGNNAEKDLLDCFSGSGAIGRFVDGGFGLRPHKSSETTAKSFIVDFEVRSFKPIPSFVVDFDYPLFHRNDQKDATAYKVPGRKEQYTPEMIIEALAEHDDEFTRTELQVYLEETTGMKRTTFGGFYKLLKDKTKVIFVSKVTKKVNLKNKPKS